MDVEAFDPEKHYKLIRKWLLARNLDENLARDLPRRGFVVMERDKGVAAGFLRDVETRYVMIDSLITNPEMEPHKRSEAIDILVDKLIVLARKMGITKIISNTSDDNTLKRSKKFGFIAHPLQTVITLDL